MNRIRFLCLMLLMSTPLLADRPDWVDGESLAPHPGGGWSWTVRSDPAENIEAARTRVELLAIAGLQNEIARRRGDLVGDLSVVDSFDDRWIVDRYAGEITVDDQTMHEAAWRVHLDESDLATVQSRVDAGVRRERVRTLGSIAAVGLLFSAVGASVLSWIARRRQTI